MPPDVCRRLFAQGARGSDLAVVEGTLEEPTATLSCEHHDRPGGLAPIARALDLPTVALLSCPRWESLHLPNLPPGVDAVLIDGLEDPDGLREDRLGGPDGPQEARDRGHRGAARDPMDAGGVTRIGPIAEELLQPLAESFRRFVDLPAPPGPGQEPPVPGRPSRARPPGPARFRVAYAQDEAFGGYFPDTLETLEALAPTWSSSRR